MDKKKREKSMSGMFDVLFAIPAFISKIQQKENFIHTIEMSYINFLFRSHFSPTSNAFLLFLFFSDIKYIF
jgi:hypothetical protein